MIEFYLIKRNPIISHDYIRIPSAKNFLSTNSSLKIMHALKKYYSENATVGVIYTNFSVVVLFSV